jgi:16S rRNA (adenine1518-N6/adenine1519-N6)-dimethyltransferase
MAYTRHKKRSTVKEHIAAKKTLGQHFLTSRPVLSRIATAIPLSDFETIVEVGPGTGHLTELLLEHSKKLIAVEKDRDLIPLLKKRFGTSQKFSLIEGDVLDELKKKELFKNLGSYAIIANLPYYITGQFLRSVFALDAPPRAMVLLLQKEVAIRICAAPPSMSMLSLSCQLYSRPKVLFPVKRGLFSPPPKVDSAVIVFHAIQNKEQSLNDAVLLLAKAGFSHKRKLLRNNISGFFDPQSRPIETAFSSCNIGASARAQELSLDAWKCLAQHSKK